MDSTVLIPSSNCYFWLNTVRSNLPSFWFQEIYWTSWLSEINYFDAFRVRYIYYSLPTGGVDNGYWATLWLGVWLGAWLATDSLLYMSASASLLVTRVGVSDSSHHTLVQSHSESAAESRAPLFRANTAMNGVSARRGVMDMMQSNREEMSAHYQQSHSGIRKRWQRTGIARVMRWTWDHRRSAMGVSRMLLVAPRPFPQRVWCYIAER